MSLTSAIRSLTGPAKSLGHLSSGGHRWINMPGYVALCLELAILLMLPVSARTITVPIYWNSSSPMFQTNDSVLDFWEGDSITLVCPYYTGGDSSTWEYYIVNMVSKHSYDMCVINDTDAVTNMITCDTPSARGKHYTHLMMAFSPTGVDFRQGNDYYFISTSGGKESELKNMYHGACKENNMRLRIRFHGRRPPPDNTGGSSSGSGSSNNNNNQPDPPLTQPTPPPTVRSTTTTTTTEVRTPRPAVSTAAPTLSPTRRPKPLGGGSGMSGGNNEPIPGSDGFPSDETVIHAGGGNRGGRDSNINSGVIEDSSARDSGRSGHGAHGALSSLSRLLAIATGLVISYVCAHADLVRGR